MLFRSFKLSYEDGIILSDCGQTYRCLSKYFNMTDETILEQIRNIMDNYSLRLKESDGVFEIYIQINDENSAFMSFLWLFSAIERMIAFKTENLFDLISDEIDTFCKNELIRIALEEKLSFAEAKEKAQELYLQAVKDDSENASFKRNAYKKIVKTLERSTESCYEFFKSTVLDEEEEEGG